jgi:hypothetical protein
LGLFRSVHLGETNCDGLQSPILGASGAEGIAVANGNYIRRAHGTEKPMFKGMLNCSITSRLRFE